LTGVDSANAVKEGASTFAGAIGVIRARCKRLGVEGVRSATGSEPESAGIRSRCFQRRNPVSSIASNETITAKMDTLVFAFISPPFTIHRNAQLRTSSFRNQLTRYLIKILETSSKEIETMPVRLALHARTRALSSTSGHCRAVTVFCAVPWANAIDLAATPDTRGRC
jgi:hypothetical protein